MKLLKGIVNIPKYIKYMWEVWKEYWERILTAYIIVMIVSIITGIDPLVIVTGFALIYCTFLLMYWGYYYLKNKFKK